MAGTSKVLTITLEFDLEGAKTSKPRLREAWAAATTAVTEVVTAQLLAKVTAVRSEMSYDYRYLMHVATVTAPEVEQTLMGVGTEAVTEAVNEEIGNGEHPLPIPVSAEAE